MQQALVVGLVTGQAFPPVRLDLIKNLPHPKHAAQGCRDPDCLLPQCKGNRIVVTGGVGETLSESEGDEGSELSGGEASSDDFSLAAAAERLDAAARPLAPGRVTWHILHGKNDRRACKAAYQISFQVPPGLLATLLIAHVRRGHQILTQEHASRAEGRLFVTDSGRAFNDSTFAQYWTAAMSSSATPAFGITAFPASKARTIFVEAFTEMDGGMAPEFWDGASAIMGNTTKQWMASYNPSKRQRSADAAMGSYSTFVRRQCLAANRTLGPQPR